MSRDLCMGWRTRRSSRSYSSFETVKVWKSFEHRSGYTGEVFVEPETGMVLRTITTGEFKPNEILSSQTVRTDYAPLPVGAGTLVVPIRRFKITEFVEKDVQTGGKATKRHRFVTEDFKDFQRSNEAAAIPIAGLIQDGAGERGTPWKPGRRMVS